MNFLRRQQKTSTDQPHSEPNSIIKTKTRSPKSTLKQEKFVEGVIQHGNATRAARDAGYSPRSASVIASRILHRPDIQEQIKSRIEAAKLDTDEIIGTLIGHMRADISNLLGDDGRLDLIRAIENGSTHIIKKLVIRTRRIAQDTSVDGSASAAPVEETTYEIVLHDSQAAAWRLARILHLEVKNRPIEARRPTDDELAHRMADLLERARANGRREAAKQRPPMQPMQPLQHIESRTQNAPAPALASATARLQPEHSALRSETLRNHAPETLPETLPATLNAPREFLGTPPTGNGLWNRLFSPQTLTFINPSRPPFGNSEHFGTTTGPNERVFGYGPWPEPSLFGLLRS
jgi:hypothetical protein